MTKDIHQTQTNAPHPRWLRFRERVILRIVLFVPILLGICFAPDSWHRYIVALAVLLNFLSTEEIYSKLRKL